MNTNETYKVGIYLRLSKDEAKDRESASISNQREYIWDYIRDNQLTYVDEYVDDGFSGGNFDRDGFNRMIQDIESKKIEYLNFPGVKRSLYKNSIPKYKADTHEKSRIKLI